MLRRRQVSEHPQGWTVVPDGPFVTTDRELAAAVARQLDRVDPLPCPEHGDWIELGELGKHPDDYTVMCGHCGETATRAEWEARCG